MKKHVTKSRSISRIQVTKSPASNAGQTIHPLCDERFTALPPSIDIAALATLYNSQPKSHVAHEYLLEQARRSLLKYELAQADLELAADSLARAMHLLIEQHGLEHLPAEDISRLERDILEWYGLSPELASRKTGEPEQNVKPSRHSLHIHPPQPPHQTHGTSFTH